MKANAPEKIYLHPTAKNNVGANWLTFPLTDNDIEYTRTDAFVEKTWDLIDEMIWDYLELKHPNADTYFGVDMERFKEDLKKAMKL